MGGLPTRRSSKNEAAKDTLLATRRLAPSFPEVEENRLAGLTKGCAPVRSKGTCPGLACLERSLFLELSGGQWQHLLPILSRRN